MLIGVTGKSCSGKNHICRLLSAKGFEVWDLDREAEKIRKQESNAVMEAFGTTDKTELSSIVFNNPENRTKLENIIYPKLIEKIRNYKYDLVINGATIRRSGLDSLCSYVIYVDAPYETRLKRAEKRDGISAEKFELREKAQADIDYTKFGYRCPVALLENCDNGNVSVSRDLDRILMNPPRF